MGPNLPPIEKGTIFVKSSIVTDIVLAVVMAGIAFFTPQSAGLGCLLIGCSRIFYAFYHYEIRWDEASEEEMNFGHAIVVAIGLVWIAAALILHFTSPAGDATHFSGFS